MAQNPDGAYDMASKMLRHHLHTKQTSDKGLLVEKLLVVEPVRFTEEWYVAMAIDRENYSPAIIVSQSGGVDIETTGKERLRAFPFSLSTGITPDVIQRISEHLVVSPEKRQQLWSILQNMYRLFKDKDATLLEINPLAWTTDDVFCALDAKFQFDNAAEKRQPELFSLRDPAHEVPEEIEAERFGLVYVRMEGNIGNVVNGAGLAMATNDAIGMYGGASANFLDTGGQATKETMQEAFKIIMEDSRVKTILVNIYGGKSGREPP